MKPARAIALMYHDVVPAGAPDASGFPGADAGRYKLTVEEFTAQLEALRGLPVGLIEPWPEGPAPLLLTFDDGGASAYAPVADLLEERGWRGHFFVAAAYVGQPGFLTRAQVRELRRRGHLVGSHSWSHPRVMRACGAAELREEWRRSASALAEILGEAVRAASVPGGYYSAAVAEAAAEAGIRVLFHSVPVTRVRREGGCLVLGRYAVMAGMRAGQCAALAQGRRPAALREWLRWQAKQAAKGASLGLYLRVRDWLVNR
jgi:peptidoglycan/xylan/chitin deacetylase (PgdA/CDA1 family)